MESANGQSYVPLSLSQSAVRYIEDKILYGQLKSGDHINEYAIAEELKISRAPVREAIRTLQTMGVLDFIPRKGSTVAQFSKEDINEIFDIRLLLENNLLDIIMKNKLLEDKHILAMYEKCTVMARKGAEIQDEALKVYTLNDLDLDFHSYIWAIGSSPRRTVMLRNLFMQLLVFMNNNTKTLGSLEEKAKEHFELVEALKSQDIQKAQTQLDLHINSYRSSVFDHI